MGYAFDFEGRVFTPDGKIEANSEAHNRATEEAEIKWLKTHPDKVFLYIGEPKVSYIGLGNTPIDPIYWWHVQTWLGTKLAVAHVGPKRKFLCWGCFSSIRRAVSCVLFGQQYHGWYFESSGDYCRLRKAKR